MNINKWKSCAVDIDSYHIIRAMGKNGFRRPGSMIAKLVDEEIKKIARKEGKSYQWYLSPMPPFPTKFPKEKGEGRWGGTLLFY